MVLPAGACDVPDRTVDSGGVDLEATACGRGTAVVQSDYSSSNVSLLDSAGVVRSASFISSGSARAGLGLALSGDVVLPSMPMLGDHLVLIDRYPAAVLSWVRLETAEVEAQLSVATGFASNPHDYATISEDRAYVLRFESNPNPGREPFDGGGDVLVIDPTRPAIADRIDLGPALGQEPTRMQPHPERIVVVGGTAYVTLSVFTADYLESAASRLVAIDPETNAVSQVLTLDGLYGCAGVAVAPAQDELAVACTGDWGGDSSPDLAGSAVVRIGIAGSLAEIARYPARDLQQGPLGFAISYADADRLLVVSFGGFDEAGAVSDRDELVEIELGTGSARPILRASGDPFTLGDLVCSHACSICLLADAGLGVVHRIAVTSASVIPERFISVERSIGLPPREIGQF
jgi:hypothetical protein